MRIFAYILSAFGLYFLLRRLDLHFQVIPLHVYGSEGGLVEIGSDMILGVGASSMAAVLAFAHFVRARTKNGGVRLSAVVPVAWSCLLLLAFILCLWL